MPFDDAILNCFRNYANFSGRAMRSEYWWWMLFAMLCGVVASLVSRHLDDAVSLALLLPGLAVGARRLHDIDRSGWWLLLTLTGIGIFVLLYWECCRGTVGPNRFGHARF